MTFEAPLYLQNADRFSYSARQDRFLIDTLFTEGLLNRLGMGAATQRAAAANLSVDVAPFDAIIDGDDVARQGAYLVRLVEGENVPVAAPPSSGSRLDLLVCEVLDSDAVNLNGRPEGARLRAIAGAATTGTPVLPALPPTAIPLWSFPVASTTTAILTSALVDQRTQSGGAAYSVTQGTNLEVLTTAARLALSGTALYAGRAVYDSGLKGFYYYDGTAWRTVTPVAPDSTTLAYNADGTLATVTETTAGATSKTTTLTYTSGLLTKTVEAVGAARVTKTLGYNGSSQLTTVTRVAS